MRTQLTRRKFMGRTLVAAGGLLVATLPGRGPAQQSQNKKGPRLEVKTVEEFVRVAHFNFERVKELLEGQPALVNATWDWGGGDWETGLGAAAHMGRRDVALYLLENNARMDVFAAAMLGKLEIVQAAVTAFPGIHKVPGPHGIPLIAHARKGGDEAAKVLRFLETLDAA